MPDIPVDGSPLIPHGDIRRLSVRGRRALERLGIETLAQLADCSKAEILDIHNVGDTTVHELRLLLQRHGYTMRDGARVPRARVVHDMTLRDYFAGQALAAIIAAPLAPPDKGYREAAREAYEQADAMLKAREETP